MKSIQPLGSDDEARQQWEQRPVEAAQEQVTSSPQEQPLAQTEHFLRPVDMSALYPQVKDRQGPLSTGTVSSEAQKHVADLEYVTQKPKRGLLAIGVYILGVLILADVATLLFVGREPSILEATAAILVATVAFGLLTWRELARKVCVAGLVVMIIASWWFVYAAHQSHTALSTQIATHEDTISRMRAGGAGDAIIADEQQLLDEAKQTQALWPAYRVGILVRATAYGLLYGGAVIYLSLPRVRQEFS